MAVARRERFGFEGPGELVRRLLEGDWEGNGLLKVEEFRDGDDLVVRSELPGIDPGKDAELTVSNGMLHIRAERREKSEDKGEGPPGSFAGSRGYPRRPRRDRR